MQIAAVEVVVVGRALYLSVACYEVTDLLSVILYGAAVYKSARTCTRPPVLIACGCGNSEQSCVDMSVAVAVEL